MKKICTVVGARPQFIKLAVVSRVLRREFQEVLIHTGQHYDHNMSDVFFEEMDIPRPDYNLGVSGGTHAQLTGRMMIGIEEVLLKERPDMLLLFGDTDSTLAAALAAAKLYIPICHVESGSRQPAFDNPEEFNRVLTDRISSLNLCCTEGCVEALRQEGLASTAFMVGDPMYDAFLWYASKLDGSELQNLPDLSGKPAVLPEEFYYMTCHREENTATDEALDQIFQAMESLELPTVYPVHPRNHDRALRLRKVHGYRNILLIQPVGYQTSISLVGKAKKVVTDSGGLRREAFFAGTPCVTILDHGSWPELLKNGNNYFTRADRDDILEKLSSPCVFDPDYQPFGDGHSAEKIVERIKEYLG